MTPHVVPVSVGVDRVNFGGFRKDDDYDLFTSWHSSGVSHLWCAQHLLAHDSMSLGRQAGFHAHKCLTTTNESSLSVLGTSPSR